MICNTERNQSIEEFIVRCGGVSATWRSYVL